MLRRDQDMQAHANGPAEQFAASAVDRAKSVVVSLLPLGRVTRDLRAGTDDQGAAAQAAGTECRKVRQNTATTTATTTGYITARQQQQRRRRRE
ncbi:hypothetical protein VTK26DRAFT_119 [Humicola hyalothermophila]